MSQPCTSGPIAASLGSFDHELGDHLRILVGTIASYESNIDGGYLSPPPSLCVWRKTRSSWLLVL